MTMARLHINENTREVNTPKEGRTRLSLPQGTQKERMVDTNERDYPESWTRKDEKADRRTT